MLRFKIISLYHSCRRTNRYAIIRYIVCYHRICSYRTMFTDMNPRKNYCIIIDFTIRTNYNWLNENILLLYRNIDIIIWMMNI